MKKRLVVSFFIALFMISKVSASTILQGHVYINKPVENSLIIIKDAQNINLTTATDENGFYRIDVSNLIAPITISSNNNLLSPCNTGNASNCISSLINTLQKDQVNIANVNPLTDLIVSDIAERLGYIGPAQFIIDGRAQSIESNIIAQANNRFYNIFATALQQVGIAPQLFNPISSNEPKINKLLELIMHNRGYNSNSGETSNTILLDMRFNPISEQTPFDYTQSLNEKEHILNAEKRIFIISDSTASNYDKKVYPRMGWGQVFDKFIIKDANTIVINGAQSGRSSRSFYNEGWLDLMVPFMQEGDYIIIAFGHNDEKCDVSNAKRGEADIAHLCTYPNDLDNNKQYPVGQEYMSFSTSLERYINFAKAKGMVPILMTPVTRFRNTNNQVAYQNNDVSPVVSNHYTKNKNGFLYWGNYSNTIKFVAEKNNIPLIDLEELSIDFANRHQDDWQSYWLVIDPNDARYPYYKTQSLGTTNNPDTTHFQEKGALAMAKIIAKAIKNMSSLQNFPLKIESDYINE
ncbi:rhamnogalacturonan acetylesterase [Orbus sturtevantii]|uniref:rhamnogalacturonan acetylesterase n=1 Tax=Orbus sturtevantii TaxID=3074109 RepID=UPI00370D1E82